MQTRGGVASPIWGTATYFMAVATAGERAFQDSSELGNDVSPVISLIERFTNYESLFERPT